MSKMSRGSLAFAAVVLCLGSSGPAAASDAAPAKEVAARAIGTMAGPAWDSARYLSFTFNVERDGKVVVSFPQSWDRETGRYKVSGKTNDGHQFVIVLDVNTRQGNVLVDGEVPADSAAWLERGYRRFINDTYWLLMPLKMLDPGTHLEPAGARTDECGRTWDVVKLTFDEGIGLTPKDQYWPWVNRDTGLVDRWDMLLQGSKPGDEPSPVHFHRYERFGGLLLSTVRVTQSGRILLGDIVVSSSVPPGAFELKP
ncbi:MAG TPA: hypothetical protein VMT00_11430 [Thermoanaerobaculia bacterium]|nr:hypothetical protein [Thermoanaerobaculia bacterium]